MGMGNYEGQGAAHCKGTLSSELCKNQIKSNSLFCMAAIMLD